MLGYKDLIYSSPNWRETLIKFKPIENNRDKIAMEPYPNEQVLAAFAKLAYSNCKGELVLPGDWSLLTTAKNNSLSFTGYFGCAFWSPSLQQIVIAHRGTKLTELGALWADGKGVLCNRYTNHMCSAITFAEDVKEEILKINKEHYCHFVLSFSGHSLGAWLAGVTTLTVKYLKRDGKLFCRIVSPEEGLHAHTLALDSPGVEDMLIKIRRDFDDRYNPSMFTDQIDITNILSDPNMVNSTGFHVGDIQHIPMKDFDLSSDSKKATLFYNLDAHDLDSLIIAIGNERVRYVVENWPQGLAERKKYQELMKQKETKEGTDPSSKNYRYNISLRNTCHLGVFSREELKFVKNMSFFRSGTIIKLSEIENFQSSINIDQLDFPEIKINARRKTITCDSNTGDLERVVRQTKQLFRWFSKEIMDAVNKQNESIKSAPLYLTGQAYLRTLPNIMNCEDTLELNKFLKNPNQRVLQIETSDTKFEAARLNNILINTEITRDNEKYLKDDNYHTSLSWNNLTDVAKKIDIEALKKRSITINNLLILEFDSPTDNSLQNDLFKKLLTNLVECSHKKLVIILQPENKNRLFKDFTLTVVTKPLKAFALSDLTITSREDIFERDAIALGEKTLSLNTLLGVDCQSVDEQVRNKINSLISPISKKLAIDPRYRANIPIKLPRLCELEALYSKGNRIVDKEKLTALLERSGAAGPLLVISDPEQLSQDYWGEGAEPARERIFKTEDDGQDLFMEKCREESSARIIYWLNLSAEGLSLREVYNGDLYMPRKFHTRFVIKSMNDFIGYSGNKDVFIFNNAKDKISFISSFNLSKEDEEKFVSKEHFKLNSEDRMREKTLSKHNFKMQKIGDRSCEAEESFVSRDHFKNKNRFHELNTRKENIEEKFNKHYFKKLEIRGSPCLVWQYSHGSLDGLRPFIIRDCSDSIEEDAFCNTGKKLTIIADDPGMGKTTSLTRISELIRDSWVLRIDHNHLTAIDKLPSKLNLRSVTKCLIHASGLPTDDDFLRSLLQHCLESDSSRQVCILVDAFDEITKENSKIKTLQFLKYLKNTTNCKTVLTTRVHPQEWLENELSEFSTELQKITKTEQDDFMVKSWLPHLALELSELGEKGRLRQFARELREEVEGVLGKDVASFMGIPLQIRMLTEVFIQQAIQSVVSPEQAQNLCKITNLFDLYTQFIEVKKSIYFEQKSIFNKGLPPTIQDEMFSNIMEKHCVLAFQSLVPKFAAEYFSNTILYNQHLQDISGLGLIKARIDGTVTFIHRTFEEYFCADFFVQWLRQRRQTKEYNKLVKSEFCFLLLRPDYYLIRKFIETQLAISPPIPSDALKSNPILYKHWSEYRQLFFHDSVKTPLHVAAEEQNMHTFTVLLSGPSSRISEEDYICFMAARDKAGRTALNIALENRNLNIVKQIEGIMENSSYESLLKLMLTSFLDFEGDKEHKLFSECISNKQPSSSLHRALTRTEQIRKQITPFMRAVREDDNSTVNKILSGLESDTERTYLLIAIDSQGDTAINLAASKEDHRLFKLFAKQGVCMSFDKYEKNPLHCAAKQGNLSIVKYLLNPLKYSFEGLKKTAPFERLKTKEISFSKHTINNDNHTDEEARPFPYTGIYQMFSSIKSTDGSTALMLAAQGGHYEIVSILLEKLADIHTRDNDGWTALMLATGEGHLEIVEHLLLHGADLNIQEKNGNSALLLAALNGHLAILDKLLEKGADICVRNNDGKTALMTAASKGHLEIIEHLLLNGADLNLQEKNGDSALFLAAYYGHLTTVCKLLEKGADIHMIGNDGRTSLMAAANEGQLEIVEHLLLNGADLNFQKKDGDSALLRAANNGHFATVCKLLEKGADVLVRNNDGMTALMTAASKGYIEIVELLLLNGGELNCQNKDGCSALLLAVNNGHLATVCKLLEKGADICMRKNDGWTALMLAASKGHLEIVEHLLLNGADLNSQEKEGNSALLLAAYFGHLATICKLLEKGADICIRNNDGRTALMTAASKGHLEIVEHLLLNGADLNLQEKNGDSALFLAAYFGHLATVRKLLEKGADIHMIGNDGCTALMLASSEGHLEIVEQLLLNGADLNSKKKNGYSALLLAANNGHFATVCKLLEKGADFHVRGNDGWTALMLAANEGHLEIVEHLLLNGAELNSQEKNGTTGLIVAANKGHLATVCKLLEKGADIHIKNNDGWTALILAASEGHLEIVEHLLLNGADLNSKKKDGYSALLLAANNGHFATVCKLLEKGADVHSRGNDEWTALMLAAEEGHLEIVEHLLLNGAELNSQEKNGTSGLIVAANKGHLAIVCKLLEKGADIHMKNNDGWTALMAAADEGHLEIVEYLLMNGAELNSQKYDGYTALLLAANNGHLATVCKLLEKGADICIRKNNGWTALMLAASKGHLEIVEHLLLNGAVLNSQETEGDSALLLAAINGHLSTVSKLLEKGADIHIRNNVGRTALTLATSEGHLEIVEHILLKGADIHMTDNDGCTALMLAARDGYSEIVEHLQLNRADLNIQEKNGNSALLLAALNGHLATVCKLLEKRADIHIKNNDGWTALILSASAGHLEIVEHLLMNGAELNSQEKNGYSALIVAANNGHLATVCKLLEKGADIHMRNNDGWTALMSAADEGHLEIVEHLLLNGTELNSQNKNGCSALLLAANNGHLATVSKLLEKGADIHVKHNDGWTALNYAAARGHFKVAKLLLLNGANLNLRDKDGDTAFHTAAANGHSDMVVLLLQRGVHVNSQNDVGRTALSWAAHEGHVNVVEVLLQHNADVSYQDKDGNTALSWAEEKGHREVVELIRSHQDANPME